MGSWLTTSRCFKYRDSSIKCCKNTVSCVCIVLFSISTRKHRFFTRFYSSLFYISCTAFISMLDPNATASRLYQYF